MYPEFKMEDNLYIEKMLTFLVYKGYTIALVIMSGSSIFKLFFRIGFRIHL